MLKTLVPALEKLGVTAGEEQLSQLESYCGSLLEKNKVMNLTAITQPEQVALLHFADSAAPLKFLPRCASVIDIGTGAGFPGLPMKILRPDLEMTLFDSLQKRVDFLSETCAQLGVNARCVHGRAEEAGLTAEMRESFDCAVSRAVARLDMLCELCLPLVKVGGVFLAMKSSHSDEEAASAGEIMAKLGGELEESWDYSVGDALHRVYVVRKVSATPGNFPRRWAKMKKVYAVTEG